jgi:hypothetical protein
MPQVHFVRKFVYSVTVKFSNMLEDAKINIRIKLSALWATVMFCYIEGDFATFFPPGGYIQQSLAGKMGPFRTTQLTLLAGSVFISIPSLMVFFSLVMKPKWCRRINIIAALFYMLVNAVSSFTSHWAYFIFFGILETLLTLLIVRYAWKWLRGGIGAG